MKILGIDVTDTDTSVMCSDSEEAFHFPAAICRDKSKDLWYIGEEAFEKALSGKGILTDRLLKMTRRGGTATIRGVRHEGEDLLCRYLSVLKERCLSGGEADAAVIVLPDYRKAEEDRLLERLERLGFPAGKTYLISREDQMAKENSFYAKYPKDLQEIIHLKGVVNRAIHKAERNGK